MRICINSLDLVPDWQKIRRGCGILTYSAWQGLTQYHNCPKIWTTPFYYLLTCLKTAGWMTSSVDPDQIWCSVESGLSLNCLVVPASSYTYCHISWQEGYKANVVFLCFFVFFVVFFLYFVGNCCGYWLGATYWDASNEYPQRCFCGEISKLLICFGWKKSVLSRVMLGYKWYPLSHSNCFETSKSSATKFPVWLHLQNSNIWIKTLELII